MSNFFRDIIKVSSSNTLAAFINIIIGIIITRQLGPEGRGIYAAILVIPLMVLKFSELGIRRSIIYHIGKKAYEEHEIVGSLVVTIIITTVLGIGISFFILWLQANPAFTIPMIVLAVSRIPLQLIRRYSGGYFMGKQMFNTSIAIRWIYLLLYLATIILFLLILKMGIVGALVSILVSNLIISIAVLWKIFKEVPLMFKVRREVFKSLLKFGIMYSAATFFMMLHSKIDILILTELSTMEQIGFYSLAVAIATNWQIPFAVGGVIISKSANSEELEVKNENIAKLLRVAVLLGILSYIILYFAAPFLVGLLYGKEFIPSVLLIKVLLPGILFLIITKILGSRLAGEGKPYIFMFIAIPALLINIVLNFIWIPQYQALGAALSTDVSYIFQSLVGVIVYSKVVKMPVVNIFKYRKSDFDFIPVIKQTLSRKLNSFIKKK